MCVAKGCVGFLRVLEVEVGCCDVEREESAGVREIVVARSRHEMHSPIFAGRSLLCFHYQVSTSLKRKN